MKIEIEKNEERGFWVVRCGDRWEQLTGDEALYVIAAFVLKGPEALPYLRSPEQHAAWQAKYGPKSDAELAADQKVFVEQRSAEADEAFPNVRV